MATTRSRAVSITDVAKRAGVSVGTASKALNGRGQLREETRERVRTAAQELHFVPNAAAQSLHTGRTFTVGIITTDSYGRFSIPVMRGTEDALGMGRIAAFLCDSRDDVIREQHYVGTLLSRRVDGIIVAGRRTDPRPPLGRDLPVPVVYAFAPSEDPGDSSVVSDEAQGVREAIEHLVRTGRRHIAHVTGPRDHASAVVRAESARSAVAAHGLELLGDVWFGGWSQAWGRSAATSVLKAHPEVDAILCGSDVIAAGVAEGLREAGRQVPAETAIVGMDNWKVIAEATRPALTTVDLNLEEVGRKAGELLLAALDGKSAPGVHVVPCSLVIRESTAHS